ncbi:MAG: hypothetical protein J1F02_06455 [Lachnospiraceae bacterium]|nr:hypothetical protein [Lachnospiraceae bacterium]
MNKIIILSQMAALGSLCLLMINTAEAWLTVPVVFTLLSIVLNVIVIRSKKKGG